MAETKSKWKNLRISTDTWKVLQTLAKAERAATGGSVSLGEVVHGLAGGYQLQIEVSHQLAHVAVSQASIIRACDITTSDQYRIVSGLDAADLDATAARAVTDTKRRLIERAAADAAPPVPSAMEGSLENVVRIRDYRPDDAPS